MIIPPSQHREPGEGGQAQGGRGQGSSGRRETKVQVQSAQRTSPGLHVQCLRCSGRLQEQNAGEPWT